MLSGWDLRFIWYHYIFVMNPVLVLSQSGLEHAILYFDGGEGNYYGNYRHDKGIATGLYPVLYRTV